jgi:hypothetical protein
MREYLNQPSNAQYTFRYTDETGKTTDLNHEISDASAWPNAVEAFLSFLEIVYGYPIKQDVLYDVDIYSYDCLTRDRLVYTNWQPRDEDKTIFSEE